MNPLDSPQDEEEIFDAPMSAEELADIRRARNQSTYEPKTSLNPLHEGWTDTEVIILSPLWDSVEPLSIEELDRRLAVHPAKEVHPGRPYYHDAFEYYARYCLRRYLADGAPQWLETCKEIAKQKNCEIVLTRLKGMAE